MKEDITESILKDLLNTWMTEFFKKAYPETSGKGLEPKRTELQQLIQEALKTYLDTKTDPDAQYNPVLDNLYTQINMVVALPTAEQQQEQKIKQAYEPVRTQVEQAAAAGQITPDEKEEAMGYINLAESQVQLDQLVQKYQTTENRIQEITDKSNAEINALRVAGYDEQAKNAEKARDKEVAALKATMSETATKWVSLCEPFYDFSAREIRNLLKNITEIQTSTGNSETSTAEIDTLVKKTGLSQENIEEVKRNSNDLKTTLTDLEKQLNAKPKKNPFGAMLQDLKGITAAKQKLKDAEKALKDAEKSKNQEATDSAKGNIETQKKVVDILKKDLKQASLSAATYLGDVGTSFQKIGEAADNANLASVGKALSEAGDVAKKMATGDFIGGGLSAVTSIFSAIFGAKAEYEKAQKQMADDQAAFALAYKLSIYDMQMADEAVSGAFGKNAIKQSMEALNVIREARLDYLKMIPNIENIKITLRHKTWIRKADRRSIKDLYPELFDGEDGFNIEAARALLATNNQLNDEMKQDIQNAIDMYDKWEEAKQQFQEYISSTYGEIGGGLGDAIVTAFENGTDAMEEWESNFENVLKNLGKQLMYTLFFEKYFKVLEDDLQKAYETTDGDPNATGEAVQNILGRFFSGMAGTVEIAGQWYSDWTDMSAEYGFDLSGPGASAQEPAGKGFETMSQDTASELNGRFTAMQMAMEETKGLAYLQTELATQMNGKLDVMLSVDTATLNVADNIRDIQVNSFLELQEINLHTKNMDNTLRTMSSDLEQVKKNTGKL